MSVAGALANPGPGIPDPPPGLPVERQIQRHEIPEGLLIKKKSILGGLHHEYRFERLTGTKFGCGMALCGAGLPLTKKLVMCGLPLSSLDTSLGISRWRNYEPVELLLLAESCTRPST